MNPPTEVAATRPDSLAPIKPTFAQAFRFWLKLGFISFGGPAGQIAIMQTELVEKRRWISQSRFLHALNFCMLLPGPEAQQLAIYVGWLLHRTWGGIVAGSLFVIPSMFVLWALSFVYAVHGDVPWIAAIFYGLKPAVTAIVAFAVIRIGKKALKSSVMWSIATTAFIGIFFFKVPFPVIVLAAGAIGLVGGKLWREKFFVIGGQEPQHGTQEASVLSDEDESPGHAKPSWIRATQVCLVCGLLWWLPILSLGLWQGWDSTLFQEGLFFSKAAMVTFGGAYAVLPYVAQQAVETLSLASARADAGRTRSCRNHSRPPDHGAAICWLHGRMEESRHIRRRCWLARSAPSLQPGRLLCLAFFGYFLVLLTSSNSAAMRNSARRYQQSPRRLLAWC